MMEVRVYRKKNGREPLVEWLSSVDRTIRRRIWTRVQRLEDGNFGDCKFVGDGVYELRFFFGGGYRLYYAQEEKAVILLLCGGDKSTQQRDIEKAIGYLRDYREST